MRTNLGVSLCSTLLVLLAACESSTLGGRMRPPVSSPMPTPPDAYFVRPDAGMAAPPGDAGARTPQASALPCDVEAALVRACSTCHGATPTGGAPMSLVTHADLHRMAPSGVPMWERAAARLADGSMPQRPITISSEDRAALEAYFDASAMPTRPAGETCDPVAPPVVDEVGPAALPCTPSHSFRAHAPGDRTRPFTLSVPERTPNQYTCFVFENPFPAGTEATAWAPDIDVDRVLHHWILWGSDTAPRGGADIVTCDVLPTGDAAFVMGWAPGGRNVVLPDDVSLELRHRYYYLQVHYYDTTGATENDQTGVSICTTPTPRANTAGVLTVGDVGLYIPPRGTGSGEHTCRDFTGELNVLSSSAHMHQIATSFRSEVVRRDGSSTVLSDIPVWDFGDQQVTFQDPIVRVSPGDGIRVRCNYRNPESYPVTFGENSEQEMCFDFLMVYPIRNVRRPICVSIF
jgi:hypothetical protein